MRARAAIVRSLRRTAGGAATVVGLVATVGVGILAGTLLAVHVVGLAAYVVMSGSMGPAVPMGSLVLVAPTRPEAVQVGDVITYTLPDRAVTHRVVAIQMTDQGPLFTTKGDANPTADLDQVRPTSAVGTVRAAVPVVGFLIVYAQAYWRPLALVLLVLLFGESLLGLLRAEGTTRVAFVLALLASTLTPLTYALYTAATSSPGNVLATGTSLWFGANGVGALICAGADRGLACGFGIRTKLGVTVTATFTLMVKDGAGTYRVAVSDATGPAGISTIVTATFASSGSAAVTIAAGASDVVNVALKLRGSTPHGAYTGTVVLTDISSGRAASIPLWVTYP